MKFLNSIPKTASLVAIGLALLLPLKSKATGPIPINSPQSGTLNFVTNGASPLIITNQFPVGYTYPPVMQFYLTSGFTNALPLTNTILTTTNFAVQLATPTNCTVLWNAFAGVPRIQFGTNVTLANAPTNINFNFTYAQTPFVQIQQLATNVPIAVTAITLTNFTVSAGAAEAFNWESFGITGTGGPGTVTY